MPSFAACVWFTGLLVALFINASLIEIELGSQPKVGLFNLVGLLTDWPVLVFSLTNRITWCVTVGDYCKSLLQLFDQVVVARDRI